MTLTKADIVETLRNHLGLTRKESLETTETLLGIIKGTLESGEDVLISGFGKFCVKAKKERKGRNPATGGDMMITPRKVVTFKCSGKLREMINGGLEMSEYENSIPPEYDEEMERMRQEMEDDPEFFAAMDRFGPDYFDNINELIEASVKVHSVDNGLDPKINRFNYWCETLYRKKNGTWFLHCEGGSLSKYALSAGKQSASCEWVIDFLSGEAKGWLRKHLQEALVQKYF